MQNTPPNNPAPPPGYQAPPSGYPAPPPGYMAPPSQPMPPGYPGYPPIMPVAVVYAQPPAQRSSARWISFVGAAFGIFGAIVALTGFFLLPSVTVFGVSLNAPQVVTLSPSPLAGLLWLVPIVSFITFLTSNVGWLVGTVNIAPHVAAGLFNMLAAGGVVLLLILDYAAEGYAQFFIGSGFWVMVAGMALVVFGGLLELVGALRAD